MSHHIPPQALSALADRIASGTQVVLRMNQMSGETEMIAKVGDRVFSTPCPSETLLTSAADRLRLQVQAHQQYQRLTAGLDHPRYRSFRVKRARLAAQRRLMR